MSELEERFIELKESIRDFGEAVADGKASWLGVHAVLVDIFDVLKAFEKEIKP